MQFEFSTANRIIFGAGKRSLVPEIVKNSGSNVFLVAGYSINSLELFIDSLKCEKLSVTLYQIRGEPTISIVKEGRRQLEENKCDIVIGLGGGSILDTGKAIAALATNPGEILDYLEVIGRRRPLTKSPLPYIAIPTTGGTGSEVTRNAVIQSTEHRVKVSLRSPQMIPKFAVIDPELTYSVPPNITASTGLDTLAQLIEPYTSIFSNPITDGICLEGMKRISNSLILAYQDGSNKIARENMSLASLFGGIALTNSGLGAVHGLAGTIGGLYTAPHGAVCAALLPHAVRINIEALKARANNTEYLKRYEDISRILTGIPSAHVEDSIEWLNQLILELKIPSLALYGVTTDDFSIIVENAKKSSSMRGNPVPLNDNEIISILEGSL